MDQCGEPLICITSKDFIQLQVTAVVMIKILLDDSLHHHHTFDSCNMGTRDLPDMYAQSPRAAGPRAEGIHIRQITSAHVTTIM